MDTIENAGPLARVRKLRARYEMWGQVGFEYCQECKGDSVIGYACMEQGCPHYVGLCHNCCGNYGDASCPDFMGRLGWSEEERQALRQRVYDEEDPWLANQWLVELDRLAGTLPEGDERDNISLLARDMRMASFNIQWKADHEERLKQTRREVTRLLTSI